MGWEHNSCQWSGVSFKDNTGAATGPSITKDGINAGNKTVSNVGTAVNNTDAVNKAQLDQLLQQSLQREGPLHLRPQQITVRRNCSIRNTISCR